MKTVDECIPCFARQALEAVSLAEPEPARRILLLRQLLIEIGNADWNTAPPVLGARMHRAIRAAVGHRDPYRPMKEHMNRVAAQLLPAMQQFVRQHPDPREAAVRVAIAGNLLDAGAKTGIGADELEAHMNAIRTMPLRGDSARLYQAADQADCILYLADNAGEIVFDRILLEALPTEKVTVFVRGTPVINDATLEDAEAAGLPDMVTVLENGSDVPGTVPDMCSEEFRHWFERADLVIAKGQGNYETLADNEKHIVFLFTVKCPVVARQVGEPVGSLIVLDGLSNEDHSPC